MKIKDEQRTGKISLAAEFAIFGKYTPRAWRWSARVCGLVWPSIFKISEKMEKHWARLHKYLLQDSRSFAGTTKSERLAVWAGKGTDLSWPIGECFSQIEY